MRSIRKTATGTGATDSLNGRLGPASLTGCLVSFYGTEPVDEMEESLMGLTDEQALR